ncbi:MAG: ribosomal L7Ae/L30e/S12e/Gadd45 family protein [Clostridia bacterium]|nr:ribosomal L7Ae/L30e/S12e/Gadd45 family protein [Clostridia bacterium]
MTKADGLLGLASRAGQITLGADLALREIKGGRAGAALVDESASDGTRKKILDACAYRGVPVYILPEDTLSRACGKESRMAAALKRGKLCDRIMESLNEETDKLQGKCGGASIE